MPEKCSTQTLLPSDPNKALFANGELDVKAHWIGWMLCAIFSIIATSATIWLLIKHLEFYSKPSHQRYIVRLLLMVPIYAWVSFFSYFWWTEAIYFQLIRDCYEAIVVGSFFYLMCAFLGDNPAALGAYFRSFELKKWMFPFGRLKYRPSSGWHFLQICKCGVLQYVILRPLCTLIAVIMQSLGYYCLDSWAVYYWHFWSTLIISISVSIALYFLLQVFVSCHEELKPYRPTSKFLAVKGAVAVIFWQATIIAVLEHFKLGIRQTTYWTADQVAVGVDAIMICFEMIFFGFFNVRAFSYLPYRPAGVDAEARNALKTNKWKSFCNAFDFRDVGKEVGSNSKYMAKVVRGKHRAEYQDEQKHLEEVFGQRRPDPTKVSKDGGVEEDEKSDLHDHWPHVEEDEMPMLEYKSTLFGSPDAISRYSDPFVPSPPTRFGPSFPPRLSTADRRYAGLGIQAESASAAEEPFHYSLQRQLVDRPPMSPQARIRSPYTESPYQNIAEPGVFEDPLPLKRISLPRHDLPPDRSRKPRRQSTASGPTAVFVVPNHSHIGPLHPDVQNSPRPSMEQPPRRFVFDSV